MRTKMKQARRSKGMTQQQVEVRIGIEPRYYKAIESGERLGSIAVWDALEDLFGINQRVLRAMHPGREENQ